MANGGYGYVFAPVILWPGPTYSDARIRSATENAYMTVIGTDWATGSEAARSSWIELTKDFIANCLSTANVDGWASQDTNINARYFEVLKLSLNSPNLESP